MAIKDVEPRIIGRRLFQDYKIDAPGENTDILSTALTLSETCNAIRLTICLSAPSVINVTTTDGTTSFTNGLNESTALNAGDIYSFAFPAINETAAGLTISYNFQVETDSVIRFLVIDEVMGGTL